MIKLVIFDFDGTIVDTAADLVTATNEFLVAHGQKALPEAQIRQGIGTGLKDLLFKFFSSDPKQEDHYENLFLDIYERHHLLEAKVYPGLHEFIQSWPHQVAILSNKSERFIHSIMRHLELDKIKWAGIAGGDTFSEKKPHPLPFEKILELAQVTKDEVLMVGDGEPDILGARNSGIKSAAVEYGYLAIEELMALGADFRLKDLAQLNALIRQISPSSFN